uniref:F-box domain-containing protein n=1 Tax=Panagrolaimus sp. JU765 TaxID=591449 RepID=A0AC34RQW3_9BILA
MKKFDFLQLPLVVQDIITEEVVSNSSPKNRLQLALTSKYCNYLVQRAHPKKIIHHLKFSQLSYSGFYVPSSLKFLIEINSKAYYKTKDEMMEMLTNCQVEVLEVDDTSFLFLKSSDVLDILDKSLEFVTKLIIGKWIVEAGTIIDLYHKFRHLDTLVYKHNLLIFPHYPPNIVIESASNAIGEGVYMNFFQELAKFSRQNLLSSFTITKYISLDIFRQFLIVSSLILSPRFSKDAEIFARLDMQYDDEFDDYYIDDKFQIYLTYIEKDEFEFEVFSSVIYDVITVDQRITGKNERILVLSWKILEHATRYLPNTYIPFYVTSASSPNHPIYSGVLSKNYQEFIIKNIDSNDWIKVNFTNAEVRYSKHFLNDNFPKCDDIPPFDYLKKINNVLGTQIGITNAALRNIKTILVQAGS